MRILLTGAKGQLGRSLRERLPEDWELIATDSKTLDITDADAVSGMVKGFNPDALINTAGFTSVSAAEHSPAKAFAVNADGTRNLAAAAKAAGARFVHISTDFVFDGESRLPYRESDAPNPQSAYARSKLAGELLALAANSDTLILRTSWVFGEYGDNTVRRLMQQAARGETVTEAENQAACPTYAGDLAEAVIRLLQQPSFPTGILHYCGDRALSAYAFAQAVFKAAGELNPAFRAPPLQAVNLEQDPHCGQRPRYSALNCDLACSLGLTPSDWQKALPSVLAAL